MYQTLPFRKIQTYFAAQPIFRAWLFGSYADGSADERSDVDILVEIDYSQHIGLGFFDILWGLEKILGKKVDLIPLDGLLKFIQPCVEQQKN